MSNVQMLLSQKMALERMIEQARVLPNMSMVIISASCLIVKQVIEHPGQF